MHYDAYTGVIILIVGFIIINYISEEFIFEEKRLNEIFENKFSSKITHYTVSKSTIASKIQLPVISKSTVVNKTHKLSFY